MVIALAVGGISVRPDPRPGGAWSDPTAFIALGIGIVAADRLPDPDGQPHAPARAAGAVPPRAFTVINVSTFLIYGALYSGRSFQSVFLQGVLGYTALASAAVGLPMGILLTLRSTRVGALAGRIGPRPFLVVGPLLMWPRLLWLVRIPADSAPWLLGPGVRARSCRRRTSHRRAAPALLFGLGITLVVAPLTTALMESVPVRNAGLGSAINNAISRVGQPLILALLFIPITAVFYGSLSTTAPYLDTDDPAVRARIQPLNPPAGESTSSTRAHRPGVDRSLPSRDAGGGRPAPGRGGRQRCRASAGQGRTLDEAGPAALGPGLTDHLEAGAIIDLHHKES